VIGNCTCPPGSHDGTEDGGQSNQPTLSEGSLKTGLAITTTVSDSVNATAGKDGEVKYDVTIAAVLVDDAGVIHACVVDSIGATVKISATGTITSDITAAVQTKNELGDKYGMVAWGGAKAEWNVQVAALCDYAVGKTAAQLRSGAVNESGYAPDGSDLSTSATIKLAGYVDAIEAAIAGAKHLGAQSGDELVVATLNSLSASVAATAEKAGTAQLDANITAVSKKGGTVTSCVIDAVQAKISFDTAGRITTDLTAPIQTKNELGEKYGMVAWGGAKAEWNVQAEAFARYVTGKTASQIAGIAVTEGRPADGTDLSASVTIAIGDFQKLLDKALK
jgi:hypothetical protein